MRSVMVLRRFTRTLADLYLMRLPPLDCSGKFSVLCRLLHWLRTNTQDRIVIVSNYTQTLDLFQQLCREKCVLSPMMLRVSVTYMHVAVAHLTRALTHRAAGGTRRCDWTAASR